MTLPLLSQAIVENTYDDLLAEMSTELKNKLNNLLKYFQEQWLNKVSIFQWCVHDLSFRTNNNVQSKHVFHNFILSYFV